MLLFPCERAARGPARLARVDARRCRTTSRRPRGSCRSRRLPDVPEFLRGRGIVVIDGAIVERRGRGRRAARPAARARARDGHVRRRSRPSALVAHPHGPRGPDAGPRRHARCSTTLPARGDRRARRRRRPRLGQPAGHRRAAPPRRRARRAAGAARSAASTASTCTSPPASPLDPALVAAVEAQLALRAARRSRPYDARPRSTSNFAERADDPVAFYGEETYARLRAIKAEVDPLEIFRGNHEIPAA